MKKCNIKCVLNALTFIFLMLTITCFAISFGLFLKNSENFGMLYKAGVVFLVFTWITGFLTIGYKIFKIKQNHCRSDLKERE